MIQQLAQLIRRAVHHRRPYGPRHEGGQGLVEYAMITSLIAVAVLVVVSVGGLGTTLINIYNGFPGAF